MTPLLHLSHGTVQEHHQRKENQHYRFYAAHVGAVLIQPGGSDQREDRRVGGGEAENRQTGGCYVTQVSVPLLAEMNCFETCFFFFFITAMIVENQ